MGVTQIEALTSACAAAAVAAAAAAVHSLVKKYDFHFYVTNGRTGSYEMGYESRAQRTVRRELRTGPQTGIINRSDINSVQSCCCCCCC